MWHIFRYSDCKDITLWRIGADFNMPAKKVSRQIQHFGQVRNFTFCNPVVQLACSTQCFTRSAPAQQLHIPHSRINIQKFCPTVIGKYYWNDLSLSIHNKSSKILFKKALKKYYLAQY